MKKVAFVIGTRAEAIKILPIAQELERRGLQYEVISTGQHDLSEFKFKEFVELTPPKGKSGAFSSVLGAFGFVLSNIRLLRPKLKDMIVIVQGDTMSTAAGAAAARLAHSPVCHVESGLRTGDYFQPFPEELSRVATDRVSQVHFAPTAKAAANTPAETTCIVGNTVVDAIARKNLKITNGNFVIVSIHRQENIRNKAVMQQLVEQVEKIAKKYEVLFILPDNTKRKLAEFGLLDRIVACTKTSPVIPYDAFVEKLAACKAVLSDSGGLAEECSYLGKPLVIFRKKTERMEAVEAGNALLGLDKELLPFIDGFKEADRQVYGDGNAGRKIVDVLVEKYGGAKQQ